MGIFTLGRLWGNNPAMNLCAIIKENVEDLSSNFINNSIYMGTFHAVSWPSFVVIKSKHKKGKSFSSLTGVYE